MIVLSKYRLRELKIEVTYNCPLVCVHCSSDAHPNNLAELGYDKCIKIITEASSMGVQKIAFSGGEPLVWPHLSQMVALAHSYSIFTEVYSSGNIDYPNKMFKDLKNKGLDKAIFSLYSANSNSHERITRKRNSFNRTISSIMCCNEQSISSEIHFVATSQNYKELPTLCELTTELGVDCLSILRLVPQGRGKLFKNGTLTKSQNIELLRQIHSLRKQGYNIRTGSPMNVLYLNEHPKCLAAMDRLVISPELRIYPCDAFKQIDAEDIVGTANKSVIGDDSLVECWSTSPYLCRVRNALDSEPVGRCENCANISKCETGCLAQKFLAYGELERQPDPACLMK